MSQVDLHQDLGCAVTTKHFDELHCLLESVDADEVWVVGASPAGGMED